MTEIKVRTRFTQSQKVHPSGRCEERKSSSVYLFLCKGFKFDTVVQKQNKPLRIRKSSVNIVPISEKPNGNILDLTKVGQKKHSFVTQTETKPYPSTFRRKTSRKSTFLFRF